MAVSKWKLIEDKLEDIAKWVQDGIFEYQIFQQIGISKPTWEKYKKEKPELMAILESSREKRNEKYIPLLENTMLKLALGYVQENAVVEEVYRKDPDSGELFMTKKVVNKVVEPHVGAIQILLKNWNRPTGTPWTDNPVGDQLKREKLEMDKQIAEAKKNGW